MCADCPIRSTVAGQHPSSHRRLSERFPIERDARAGTASSELNHHMPHADRQIQRVSPRPCSWSTLPAACCVVVYLAFDHDTVPTSLHTCTPARRTHARAVSRPGSPKLSVCAALSVVDLRISPGRAAACTTRSRPPRGRRATTAAHAEHALTSKCCVGRGGVGGQRTATQHHGLIERARVFRRASRRHIGHVWGPTAVAVAVVEHQQLWPRARRCSRPERRARSPGAPRSRGYLAALYSAHPASAAPPAEERGASAADTALERCRAMS